MAKFGRKGGRKAPHMEEEEGSVGNLQISTLYGKGIPVLIGASFNSLPKGEKALRETLAGRHFAVDKKGRRC